MWFAKFCGWLVLRCMVLTAAFTLIFMVWVADANVVNWAFDQNADLAKFVARKLDTSGRLQTAFRVINVDRILLFTEMMALVLAAVAGIKSFFRRLFGGSPSGQKPPPKK